MLPEGAVDEIINAPQGKQDKVQWWRNIGPYFDPASFQLCAFWVFNELL